MKAKRIYAPFKLKSHDDSSGTFEGYASVFGVRDSGRDIVMKGAFAKSLKADYEDRGRLVKMLYQHDPDRPIGVYRDIKEDDYGLLVKGEINLDVQDGRETYSLLKQGALDSMSIGYNTIMDKWNEEKLARELHEVKLWEVSVVTFPMLDIANVNSVKSLSELTTLSALEEYLRDAGDFSIKEAKAIIATAKKLGTPRDAALDGSQKQRISNAIKILRGED